MSSNHATSPPQAQDSRPERPSAARGLELEVGKQTDTGRSRPHNEDYVDFYIPSDPQQQAEKGSIYLVADGMGGHNAGEVASEGAAKAVIKEYYLTSGHDVGTSLVRAFRMANRQVYDWAQSDRAKAGMGTTLVAAVIQGQKVTVANVGDSRAYMINAQGISQITTDHSWVEEQVAAGLLTPEQARVHPQRNVVTRALGNKAAVDIDLYQGELAAGDILLLCSDGLTGHLNDQEIAAIALRHSPQEAARLLIEQANERGGNDNISVVIVRAEAEQATVPTAVMPPTVPTVRAAGSTPLATPRDRPGGKPPQRIWRMIWVMAGLAAMLLLAIGVLGGIWAWQQVVGHGGPSEPSSVAPLQSPSGILTVTTPVSGTVAAIPGATITGDASTPSLSPQIPSGQETVPSATGALTGTLAQPTATLRPTLMPTPTSTQAPAASRGAAQTAPAPSPSGTEPPPAGFPAPSLVSPRAGEGLSGKPLFQWSWSGPELTGDTYFDLRIWADEEASLPRESRRGATAPLRTTEAEVDLEHVPAIQDYGTGNYYWTVVIIEQRCPTCSVRIVGDWGEERMFTYTIPSPGDGDGLQSG